MQRRPTLRRTRQLAHKLAQAHRSMSFPKIARSFGIVTPSGKPNPGLVKNLIDGYRPVHEDTLRRCGLLESEPKVIHDEPTRRVLTGAWRLKGRWVSPEEYFGARV